MSVLVSPFFESALRVSYKELVHGVKLRRDVSSTWCDLMAWACLQHDGYFVPSGSLVTCIACLVNQPTRSMLT